MPETLKEPAVELILSADGLLVLEITIRINGRGPLELLYRVTQVEQPDIELRGEKGNRHTINSLGDTDAEAASGTLTIPAGKSGTVSVHSYHSRPEVGVSGQKITFAARLKHDGNVIESRPLTVNP